MDCQLKPPYRGRAVRVGAWPKGRGLTHNITSELRNLPAHLLPQPQQQHGGVTERIKEEEYSEKS